MSSRFLVASLVALAGPRRARSSARARPRPPAGRTVAGTCSAWPSRATAGSSSPSLAVIAAGTFLGLAAAQPVVERTSTLETRTDAEAFVVLDVSRSMLARRELRLAERIERAKACRENLRAALARGALRESRRSPTGRFPISSRASTRRCSRRPSTRSLGIEQPPPRSRFATNATSLDALAAIRHAALLLADFAQAAARRPHRRRVAAGLRRAPRRALRRPPLIDVVFVHFWHADERVFTGGSPEPQYRPDPVVGRRARRPCQLGLRGTSMPRARSAPAAAKVRELIGSGPTVVRGEESGQIALAPYLAACALAPLALLLWRRER